MTFHAEVHPNGAGVRLRMSGELNAAADIELLAAHAQAVAKDPRTLILDFADVGYMNSSGIALIITLLTEARSAGRAVRAAGLSSHYRHIFEITRLTDYISVDDDDRDRGRSAGSLRAAAAGGTTYG